MNNALLDEIQAAYQDHNLWPTRCTYFLLGFACPLTALAIGRGVVDKSDPKLEQDEENNPAFTWACQEFGAGWVEGFVNGLDEQEKTNNDLEYLAGFELGSLALDQLFPREAPF